MDKIRSGAYFRAAQEQARTEGKEEHELESDEVVLHAAYEKALAAELDPIKMEDFEDIYGSNVITEDQKKVEQLNARFAEQDAAYDNSEQIETVRQMGAIFEAIITEQIELNEWLGPEAQTMKTTPFDDYLNGIDFVTEFRREDAMQYAGFAIDATYGVYGSLQKKLKKIRGGLWNGELGTIKYFQSSDQSVQGRKRFIPRLVLAVDKPLMIDLARHWVKGEQHVLAAHPVFKLFRRELLNQLQSQDKYVEALEFEGVLTEEQSRPLRETLQGQIRLISQMSKKDGQLKETEIQPVIEQMNRELKRVFDVHQIKQVGEQRRDARNVA